MPVWRSCSPSSRSSPAISRRDGRLRSSQRSRCGANELGDQQRGVRLRQKPVRKSPLTRPSYLGHSLPKARREGQESKRGQTIHPAQIILDRLRASVVIWLTVPVQRCDYCRFPRPGKQLRQRFLDLFASTLAQSSDQGSAAERGQGEKVENRNSKLGTDLRGEGRSETNPIELKSLISTEYNERARNKPSVVILNHISRLREFMASF